MHTKTTTDDHRIGATGLCCGRDARKSTFAEFLVPFDFRLLQQYRPRSGRSAKGPCRLGVNSQTRCIVNGEEMNSGFFLHGD